MEDIRDIYAEIAELRAELAHCILTRRERRETQLRLVQAPLKPTIGSAKRR